MTKRRNKKSQPSRPQRKKFKPKTDNQSDYIVGMSENDITFCSGPAGSGKTAVAVGLACEYFLQNKVEKIILTRPVVESGRGLGYLPGSLTEKISPYLVPVVEEIKLYLDTTLKHNLDNKIKTEKHKQDNYINYIITKLPILN